MIRILAAGIAIDDMHHLFISQEPLRFLEIHYNGGDGPLYGLVGKGMDMEWSQLIGYMMIDIGGNYYVGITFDS